MAIRPRSDMLAAVRRVVAEAGAMALARAQAGDVRRWDKAPGHPVSDVDLAVDAMLRERLGAIDPAAGWLSEETADDAVRLGCERVWVVDPIDGTRDFLRGRPGWAVSVALVEGGRPVLAVLDASARGEHWYATAGGGAWLGGVRLACGGCATLAGARIPADAVPRADAGLVAVAKPNAIALRLAMVALGAADLLYTLRWGAEWDIAAAVLIAQEAGVAVTDALGRPLAFNTPSARAFGLAAAPPALHGALVAHIAERAGPLSR